MQGQLGIFLNARPIVRYAEQSKYSGLNIDWQGYNLSINDRVIHYARNDNTGKPALVFCHGFSDNGLCWRKVASALTDQFDIVLLDARNHGESSRGAVSTEDLVQDLADVITALNLPPVLAAGHSMGAGTVASLAENYPHLVSRIILEDPAWSDDTETQHPKGMQKRAAGFAKYLDMINRLSDDQLLAMGQAQHPRWSSDDFPDCVQSKRQVDVLALQGLKRVQWGNLVQSIKCPTLLLYADENSDCIIRRSIVDEILALNPLFQPVQIKDAGHNIRRKQFKPFMEAFKAFLL